MSSVTGLTTSPVKRVDRPERRDAAARPASRGRPPPARAAARRAARPGARRGVRGAASAAEPRRPAAGRRRGRPGRSRSLVRASRSALDRRSRPGSRPRSPCSDVGRGRRGTARSAWSSTRSCVEVRLRRRRGTWRSRSCRRSCRRPCCAGASPNHSATAALPFGRDDPVHPHVRAVRVLGLGRDHPGVRPAGRALLRQDRLDRAPCRALARLAMTCHVVPSTELPALKACTSLV